MEVLSGILLACVVLGIIGYLVSQVVGEGAGAVFRKYAEVSPEDIEDPLVGQIGQVVENTAGAELMRVRIHGERWNASLIDGRPLPVGTEVRVTAVNGLVLDVEESVDEHTSTAGAAIEEPRS